MCLCVCVNFLCDRLCAFTQPKLHGFKKKINVFKRNRKSNGFCLNISPAAAGSWPPALRAGQRLRAAGTHTALLDDDKLHVENGYI